ncbi:hypothetical protein FGRMN_9892 [Fusarium graminum]|nr:hypothetical protein FGRMN_9892 [Fusarium graminum]
MGLDIAGAFDNVSREMLLQILADKGLPEQFLRMMQSFLSERSTALKLPRSTSDPTLVNVGIPQGSPLSPLLFLFFAAPLLEMLNKKTLAGFHIRTISYVDDTYIVVVSQSYADNCKALELIHEDIMKWSTETQLEFSPKKYSIMHFNDPCENEPTCRLLPDIPGVANNVECFKDDKMKVLGVVIDPQLTFKAHVDDIEGRVSNKLRVLRLTARRKSGMTIQKAREFYMGSILPIFAYACEAWFLYSPTQRLPRSLKKQVGRLDSIHYRALKVMTAYFGQVPREVVLKEFHIPNMRIYLHKRALSGRALSLGFKDEKNPVPSSPLLCQALRLHNIVATDLLDHEAHGLATRAAARLLAQKKGNTERRFATWRVRSKRKDVINAQASEEAEERSSKIWKQYRCNRVDRHPTKHCPVILEEEWGPESLEYYKSLRRAESTLLLELRSEKIALNGPLHDMQVKRPILVSTTQPRTSTPTTLTTMTTMTGPASTTTMAAPSTPVVEESDSLCEIVPASCPCGHRKQTVYHMFFHCPNLDAARQQLVDSLFVLNWKTLLTTHAKVATQWAMVHFPLAQYDYVREDSPFYTRSTDA